MSARSFTPVWKHLSQCDGINRHPYFGANCILKSLIWDSNTKVAVLIHSAVRTANESKQNPKKFPCGEIQIPSHIEGMDVSICTSSVWIEWPRNREISDENECKTIGIFSDVVNYLGGVGISSEFEDRIATESSDRESAILFHLGPARVVHEVSC
jgi:hypothetical protein